MRVLNFKSDRRRVFLYGFFVDFRFSIIVWSEKIYGSWVLFCGIDVGNFMFSHIFFFFMKAVFEWILLP